MKYIISTFILFLSFNLNAQFLITGELKDYNNKPVLIKIYENGSDRLIKRLETDSKGKFSYDFPFEYIGSLLFELSHDRFDMVSDNNPISFSVDLSDYPYEFYFDQGVNKLLKEYVEIEDKKSLSEYTLKKLLTLYKPKDDFYNAISQEMARINDLNQVSIDNPAVKYMLETKNQLVEYNTDNNTADFIINDTREHILNDNIYLENFGFLPNFLNTYISYSARGAANKDEMKEKVESALDTLLNDVQIDTSRGQAILTFVIPILEKNGFNSLSTKYLGKAESLTCEISQELKELIQGKANIQVGQKSPNILFGKKIKGAKSLYDVKANKKLVVFWASWCPHCMNELPYVKEFYNSFKEQKGEIIAISLDIEKEPYFKVTSDTKWINYSDFKKWNSPLVKTFGVDATPTMILLDKNNNIVKIGSKVSDFVE